jgi:hypothetical protein
MQGAILVAKFNPSGAPGDPIGAPYFKIDGGGDSTIAFDSLWVRRAMDLSGFRVLGVREYNCPIPSESALPCVAD